MAAPGGREDEEASVHAGTAADDGDCVTSAFSVLDADPFSDAATGVETSRVGGITGWFARGDGASIFSDVRISLKTAESAENVPVMPLRQ